MRPSALTVPMCLGLLALASSCVTPAPQPPSPPREPSAQESAELRTLPTAVLLVAPPRAPASALDPEISKLLTNINADRVHQTIRRLVSFSTRNACSTATGTAGITAARDWIQSQFAALPGVQVRLDPFAQTGCSTPLTRHNVVAWIPGAHPSRLIVIGGHYDSRPTQVADGTSQAPGANDSGSQTALVLEVARALAGHTYDATLVFASFAGEEQGLVGSSAFVNNLGTSFPGGVVELDLNADIVGGDNTVNTAATLGQVRLYSPGTPREVSSGAPDGSTDDTSPSRGVMRSVAYWGGGYVPELTMVAKLREDRPGRGSDHQPFIRKSIPGVRFIELNESLAHQHSPEDRLVYVSPAYTASVARMVAATAANLARAPSPPLSPAATVPASGRVQVSWKPPATGPAVQHYVLAARTVTENFYRTRFTVPATVSSAAVRTVEDLGLPAGSAFYVSVAAVDAAGHESLFAYPELRCTGSSCVVPADALNVTAAQ